MPEKDRLLQVTVEVPEKVAREINAGRAYTVTLGPRKRVPPPVAEENARKNIRAERGKLGLSQSELADMVGLQQTAITRMEHGQRGISLDEAVRISAALGVTLLELIGDN